MKPPFAIVDHNTCPVRVAWMRLTPSGRKTNDWHSITIKRYKQDVLVKTDKGMGRKYIPTKYHGVRNLSDAVEVVMREHPPRKLKSKEGIWSFPIFEEFVQTQATGFPDFFIAHNSAAL